MIWWRNIFFCLNRRHVPYHESDYVLNIAYNVLVGGIRLEDIELRRNDESFPNSLCLVMDVLAIFLLTEKVKK